MLREPLCESCVRRRREAGGRGDCPLTRSAPAIYAEFAAGVRFDCVSYVPGDLRQQRLVNPDQLAFHVEPLG